MTAPRTFITLIGLALSLGLDLLPLGRWGREHSRLGPLLGNEVLFWIATILVLAYVLFVEHRRLSSIGFRRPRILDALLGVLAGVLIVVGASVTFAVVLPALHLKMNTAEMGKLLGTPLWYRFILVTRAAVNEEILFRGYPIERCLEFTRAKWLAAVLPWAAFVYAHLSGWGAAQLIFVGYAGAVLAGLYLWRRNLWANMLAHWIGDGAGFLLPR